VVKSTLNGVVIMKVNSGIIPLWVLIVVCLIIISLIGLFLILCFGEEAWVSTLGYLVAALTIAIGGCVAYHHLKIIQGTERAEVLTSLDNCWYGNLADSRSEFIKFRNSLESSKDSTEYQQEIIDKLETMRKHDPDRYRTLVGMLDFYETLGYFSRVQYILPRDVIQLYGPNIKDYDRIFHEYILKFQEAEENPSIYEHFLWLTDELKKQYN